MKIPNTKRYRRQSNKYWWKTKNRNSLDEVPKRSKPRAKKESLSGMISNKFDSETLKNHLTSSVSLVVARAIQHRLPQGAAMSVKELLESAKNSGGFKKIIPTEGDFDKLEESPEYLEDSRIGTDMGTIYKKAIVLTEGVRQDSQMRTAKKLYKAQTWPCFNSESSKYYGNTAVLQNLHSQSGINRQGVWFPGTLTPETGPWVGTQYLKLNSYISPILLKQQYYDEIRSYLMSSDTISWLENASEISADIFYAINSITDTITFANDQQFLPVELKIYICKCKSRTKFAPAADWFVPTGNSAEYYRMKDDYIYDSGAYSNVSTPDGGSSFATYGETSVHLGATPFYSPTFRKNWDVVTVLRREIMPTDKFELTLHREFRNCHSIRDLEEGRNTLQHGFYCEGDYAMVITHKGLPCIVKYQGTPSAGQLTTKEVDASPTRILMTSRSSISISAPNMFESSMIPSRDNKPNYISGEGRVLDTNLHTYPYSNTDWKPSVMTNVTEKTGGAR